MTSILYVDSLESHEKEKNCMVINPIHLNLADAFQKEAFDKIIIQNSKSEYLTGKAFFNLFIIIILSNKTLNNSTIKLHYLQHKQ